jgi:hypothetical protein
MVVASRYPDAAFALAAGSIMRGHGTVLSDIDLIVMYDHVETAKRESFMADGVPVEAFIHDRETLAWFVNDDVARCQPSILNMIIEGVVIGPRPEDAEALKRQIGARLAEGSPPLSPVDRDALRYRITDAIDDLRGERGAAEIMAIGALLYAPLAELALRGRGHWIGEGKWVPRLLATADADLAARFNDGFRALFASGNCAPVIALAERELAPHGGPLFDGDCRPAPASCRA